MVGASRDHVLGFTYTPASQVQSRSASNPAYAWDGASNAVRNYASNGLNQYTAAGPATFAHDLNGNLSSTANPSFGSTSYVYDVENRLVSASGAQAAELVYDPLGRLSQVSSVAGGIRRLVYDGDALVAEYEPGGYMVHRYIHGNDAGADDPLIWYDNWNGGWRRALLTDHQGSVIQVADMYGNPVATNSYDPWGIPGATPVGRFGYTGQTWVPELGLWYYKARFYSPTTGRFLQVDPVGYEEDVNLYVYAGNDPINLADVTGKAPNRAGATSYHDVIVGLRRHTFREIADSHIGNQHRYFYTSSYGWIDIRHFATAAADVLESRHYGMTERLLGFGLEFHQFLTESGNDYRSGFSSEDLSSNAAGIDFGVLYRGTPQRDLGVAFRKWAEANGGRRLTDSPTAALPATDPSERGGRGHGSGPASDNSTNEAAQGRSNDFCAKSQPLCEAGVPR
jgi:RHS repeat-associated protein